MPRMRGFTLLEILIVVVLIAILTAAAINTINFVVDDADAETEARRVAALAGLAAEEALLTGREYGMRIDDESLQFLIFDDVTRQWQPLTEDNIFHPRPVPESLDFDLVLEGQAITLGDDSEEETGTDEDDLPEPPQVMFLSSGQITPFTLTVSERDAEPEENSTWTIEGDLLGRMEVEGEAQ
ncbi:MAG TPA: type II secretion system minor pseudopilin GspH [Gammaproteobacteria bacterium]